MNNPIVTVLMPVYNGAKYLEEAIKSVLVQSFKDFEFLIIDDGSTDNTLSIIQSFQDSRIRVICQPNAGVSAALNLGLREAKGKLIARMDSDDICKENRLQRQFDFLNANSDYILVGSDADYMDKDGIYAFRYKNIGHTNSEIQSRYLNYCPFIHSTVMYYKQIVLALNGYDDNAYLFEDYFLWIKLIKKGKVENLKEPLMSIRFNPESVTIDDRDCSKQYLTIKQNAILTGILSNNDGELLKKSSRKINNKKKNYSYHILLAKKYLWNNYQPKNVRRHLIAAIKVSPLIIKTYLLLLFSFLPGSLIQFIYNLSKRNSFN